MYGNMMMIGTETTTATNPHNNNERRRRRRPFFFAPWTENYQFKKTTTIYSLSLSIPLSNITLLNLYRFCFSYTQTLQYNFHECKKKGSQIISLSFWSSDVQYQNYMKSGNTSTRRVFVSI